MKLLIFAGTSDGRKLVEKLKECNDFEITVCVATEYGKEVLEKEKLSGEKCYIKSGRLDETDMILLMSKGFDYVIDATHPYAKIVSENIKKAAEKSKIEYLRMLREKTGFSGDDYVLLDSTAEVVKYLTEVEGNVLLAIGSKELSAYSELQKNTEKLFARVLPLSNVVEECNQNGFSGKNLICMQGPFSKDLNVAMLRQYDCKYLVTKDTGKAGGADEKYLAAKEAGAKLIVVGRDDEKGLSFDEMLQKFGIAVENKDNSKELKELPAFKENCECEEERKCTHFPMFFDISGKEVCVLGAGRIAKRRIKALLDFDCKLNIVATEISNEVRELVEKSGAQNVLLCERVIKQQDIEKADILILATNNKSVNAEVAQKAKALGKIVNVADDMELCDFYFPGLAVHKDLVCGITAQGRNHRLSRIAAENIRKLLREADQWEKK